MGGFPLLILVPGLEKLSRWIMAVRSEVQNGTTSFSLGFRLMGIDRIRLRSIIITGREKILAWARTYGNCGGTTFPGGDGESNGNGDAEDGGAGWEWEDEIMGLLNGTLGALAELDYGRDDT